MDTKFHVGVDCDGILRNFHESAFRFFFQEYPHLKEYFKSPPVPTAWGLKSAMKTFDEEVYSQFREFAFENVESSYKVFRRAEPFDEVSEFSRYYNMLKKAGGRVSICTTQKEAWHRVATVQWLENSAVNFDEIILSGGEKGHFGLDYHIDDKWQNIAAVESSGGEGYMLLRKWNKDSTNRVDNTVSDIKEFVDRILNEEVKS